MTNIPIATYRIQFNPSFQFHDLKDIVSYFSDLGISHIYASPVFKAKTGSMHGYDIVDPNQLNPELGSCQDFQDLITELKNRGMYWLQDIVPNHMAFDFDNYMLMDIFENGVRSGYYHFYDIEWDHPYIRGRVLVPVLGRFYSECLHDGEIRLCYDQKGLSIQYYASRFPLKTESYPCVLEHEVHRFEERLGKDNPDLIKYLGTIHLFKEIGGGKDAQGLYDQIRHAKRMLWELYSKNQNIKECIDETILLFNGQKGSPNSFDLLDNLISAQVFRLSFWKVATEEINYRRFFTVNDLISVKVEEKDVFMFTHKLIFQLVKDASVSGLRIDHIDGLYDPSSYLRWLREEVGDIYLVVEKILACDEKLPSFWQVEGTTGYDFLNYCNGLFCDKKGETAISRAYCKFTGLYNHFDELVYYKKRLIIGEHMAGNVDNLAQYMKRISPKDRFGRDITLYGLRRALVEVMAHFPVYRTYISHDSYEERDKIYIHEAIQRAKDKSPAFLYEFNFIEKFSLLQYDESLPEADRKQWVHLVMSFQQQSGPIMAKGFEDTVLYNYNRLISLNEVGSNPKRFGFSADEFHEYNTEKCAELPYSMNATSTHDTKRGEDARARIHVLSELPREWECHLKLWSKINRSKKKKKKNKYVPDGNDEYFLYQTLVGAFPFGKELDFIERIKQYAIKAVREAKVHTAWIKPDAEYEQIYISFVENILSDSKENRFLKDFLPFQKKIAFYGIFNSLSQALLKITSPGVPDFYQGTELWDLNLVDPDNRRPVDFLKRKEYLEYIDEKIPQNILILMDELLAAREDGRIKLFLIHRALQERKNNIDVFQKGGYIPLRVEGLHKDCIITYARQHEGKWAIAIAPRFFTKLVQEGNYPLGEKVWGDTSVILPPETPHLWNDVITSQEIHSEHHLSVGQILQHFPVSLLTNK